MASDRVIWAAMPLRIWVIGRRTSSAPSGKLIFWLPELAAVVAAGVAGAVDRGAGPLPVGAACVVGEVGAFGAVAAPAAPAAPPTIWPPTEVLVRWVST